MFPFLPLNSSAPLPQGRIEVLLSAVARDYGLGDGLTLFSRSAGRENTVLFARSHHGEKYAIRLSSRGVDEVEAEIRFVERLRQSGFARAPRFLRRSSGEGTLTVGHTHVAVYRYIDGGIERSWTLQNLGTALVMVRGFFVAKASIDGTVLSGRHRFPTVSKIVEDMSPFTEGAALRELLLQEVSAGYAFPHPHRPIHADIQPGNVLWQGNDVAALIDFDDSCLGSDVVEVLALMRGTCFDNRRLSEDKTMLVLRQLVEFMERDWMTPRALWIGFLAVCGYFFSALNRSARACSRLVMYDLERAEELIQRRREFESMVRDALQVRR